MDKLLNSTQVAEIIGVGRETILDYVAAGRLLGSKIGKRYRFLPEDVAAFVRDNRQVRGK
jgi:excisionase family DNA binding protein